ncbi:hypothetical protein H671_2g6294 [Cricetulus griseus]|uniref:Uncharacterized protein n=1 Tax=Cricetulus griseus TaxID=10029 RepID=A0A061IK60_CRIGR|nr:hypothetical protein H671_2g6294 [Cricetulus griseus]
MSLLGSCLFTSLSGSVDYRLFFYVVDYIDGFSYVEPSLHPWDEAYLIMVDNFSYMFLDSVRQYFIEYFSSDVHEGYRSIVLFLIHIFVWLGC